MQYIFLASFLILIGILYTNFDLFQGEKQPEVKLERILTQSSPPSGPTCPISLKDTFNNTNKPSLNKSDRILLPILKWGPTNQVLGFYESKKVAEYLNAKLVYPPFYLAKTDKNFAKEKQWLSPKELIVPAKLRINVKDFEENHSNQSSRLESRESSLVNLNDFKKHCTDNKNIAILLTDPNPYYHWQRIKLFEKAAHVKLIKKVDTTKKDLVFDKKLKFYPSLTFFKNLYKKDQESGQNKIFKNINDQTWIKQNWRKYWSAAAKERKCLILFTPYHSIGRSENDDRDILMDAEFSQPIQAIQQVFQETFGRVDIGLHWRYSFHDKKDWAKRCTGAFVRATHREKPPECEYVKNLDYGKLAKNLIDRVQSGDTNDSTNDSTSESSKPKYIYLASPPNENDTMSEIINHAKTITNKINFLYIFNLTKIIDTHFNSCKWLSSYREEIISLSEQAILSSSREFIYFSIDSSWGRRIMDRRERLKIERPEDGPYDVSYILGTGL